MTGRAFHPQAVWRLVVDGVDIGAQVTPRLNSLELTEKRGADADELTIVLNDHDGQLAIPPSGAVITLALGWREPGAAAAPVLIDKGRFKVDQRSHAGTPDMLTIRARSADLTRAFRKRRAQSWSETTLGAVLAEIAGRNGLQLRCAPDKAALDVAHLAQSNESDAALLSRLGRMHDAVATVKADRLIFMACGAGQTPGGADLGLARITRRDGDRHSWEEAERDAFSGVIAEWHDRAGGQRRKVIVGSDENAKKLNRTYASEAGARRAADTEFKRLQRAAAKFSLTLARGRPDLFPEKTINVSGFKPEIDAAGWLVVEARHTLNASGGLATSLQMELGGSETGDSV
ncbi:contractile injection system protein, VgrG/Pvc8 family [Brevundimonas naejangsanensis]|uniref:contractile injection system protein, VgrG/Pvc8 family n=1 Tax=Brevundimonas naejangsanensis TaxID=588932 RepID=UPI0026EACE2B|nr:contractile injection system protein, VgrG/Pvc8 family [Brevundimonas naejangsanensis]